MAIGKEYTNSSFTSRTTGPKDTYSRLHQEIKDSGTNINCIYQNGEGCLVVLNSNLVDWTLIDNIVGDHTALPPVTPAL